MTELPRNIQQLLAAEANAPACPAAARQAIRARVGASVAGGAAKTAALLKLLGVFFGVAAIGVTLSSRGAAATTPRAPGLDAAELATPPPPQVRVALVAPDASPPRPPEGVARVAPDTPPRRPVARPARAHPPRAASQTALLAAASRALSRGDGAGALALLVEDARIHADEALAEERAALRVEALLALHEHLRARAAARALLVRYPQTIHRALAERALQEAP